MPNSTWTDEAIEELLSGTTLDDARVELSTKYGYTVWASITSTGSMQVAATGHAEFDKRNADFFASARDIIRSLLAEKALQAAAIEALRSDGEMLRRQLNEAGKQIAQLEAEIAELRNIEMSNVAASERASEESL